MTTEQKREYHRRYHANRSEEAKQRKLQLQKERIQSNKMILHAYKATCGCMVCGEKDPVVLEFDHRNREDKKFELANASQLGMSLKNLFKEIEKCDVLCANCHRRKTAQQMNWHKQLQ